MDVGLECAVVDHGRILSTFWATVQGARTWSKCFGKKKCCTAEPRRRELQYELPGMICLLIDVPSIVNVVILARGFV